MRLPVVRAQRAQVFRPTFVSRTVLTPPKRNALAVVRAAEVESGSEDDMPLELEVDKVQEARSMREEKRQADNAMRSESRGNRRQQEPQFEERIIQINRVTKVLKGGKVNKFRVVVVCGDRKGQVGYGVASAKEMVDAIQRASVLAKRAIIRVPMTKGRTFPHKIQIKEGAARVMLRPASPGTGVIAGGAVRVVLELAGYQNAFGKILGTNSAMNNARGTIAALQQMFTWDYVAEKRGVTRDYAMGRVSEPDMVAS